jgi:hypothetical protein
VNLEDIVDLTEDAGDDEVEFISARSALAPRLPGAPPETFQRQLPNPRQRIRHGPIELDDGASLFVPENPDIDLVRGIDQAERELRRELYRINVYAHNPDYSPQMLMQEIGDRIHEINGRQRYGGPRPGGLNYELHPFMERRPRPQEKPQHLAPPAAKSGFTRSPTEDDIVICPACLKELVSKKSEEEKPVKKPGGKSPTKKDREEHPFWVVRDCGHVSFFFIL